MKRFSIIGLAVVLVAVIALFWIHFRHPSEISGTVQSSQMTNGGYQLSFSSSDSSDYVFVQTKALVGTEIADYLHAQNDTNSLIRLGTQYIGRRIRVAGHIQRDQAGWRFILVTNRYQITLLR
jgi:hypothetical protein